MAEIEVGEYIRNKDGYIDKVKKIIEPDEYMPEKYYCCDIIMASSYKSDIVKHSKQLIDLVEVGDYVNGHKVVDEIYGEDDNDLYFEIEGGFNKAKYIKEKDIKTILTREQYEANCYKVGGEDEL